MRRYLVPLVLSVALAFALVGHRGVARAAQTALSGKDSLSTFSGSVATISAVITAASGVSIAVREIEITSSVTGNVLLSDGSGGGTAATLNVPCVATVTRTVSRSLLEDGQSGSGPLFQTTSGNGLFAQQNGATLTFTCRYNKVRSP